jgi:hypothetical protein
MNAQFICCQRFCLTSAWVAITLAFSTTGCQQMQRVFHEPQVAARPAPERNVVLAGYAPMQPEPATQPAATQPADKSYTAPAPQFRALALMSVGRSLVPVPAPVTQGKEISESVAFSSAGVTGRAGITAPASTLASATVSRGGIVESNATGIGFASGSTILQRQANPASGPNGVCAELTRTGFSNTGRCATRARR